MKMKLDEIRIPETNTQRSTKVINSLLILLLGIALGIFSKWLDNMAIDDGIRWQYILGILDLRNVFSSLPIWLLIALAVSVYSRTPFRASLNVFLFFFGMCCSYHWYTIVFSGFDPKSYMMIWYGITLLSPIFAFICWYAKGKTIIPLIIDTLILAVMMSACFSIGFWYFDCNSIINTLIFVITALVLYSTPKRTAISLLASMILTFGSKFFI